MAQIITVHIEFSRNLIQVQFFLHVGRDVFLDLFHPLPVQNRVPELFLVPFPFPILRIRGSVFLLREKLIHLIDGSNQLQNGETDLYRRFVTAAAAYICLDSGQQPLYPFQIFPLQIELVDEIIPPVLEKHAKVIAKRLFHRFQQFRFKHQDVSVVFLSLRPAGAVVFPVVNKKQITLHHTVDAVTDFQQRPVA